MKTSAIALLAVLGTAAAGRPQLSVRHTPHGVKRNQLLYLWGDSSYGWGLPNGGEEHLKEQSSSLSRSFGRFYSLCVHWARPRPLWEFILRLQLTPALRIDVLNTPQINVRDGNFADLGGLDPSLSWESSTTSGDVDIEVRQSVEEF